MNSLKAFMRSSLVAAMALGFGAVSTPLFALQDVLETPAAATSMADKYLLLDIERAGSRLIAVGARGHIILSDDQGTSWRQASVPVSTLLTALDFTNDSTGWAVGHGGTILKTIDGGETWKKQFDGHIANKTVTSQAKAQVDEINAAIAAAADEVVVADLQASLEEAEFTLQDALSDANVGASKPFLDVLFFNSSEGIAVGAYGFIFRTKNGGQSWINHAPSMDNPDRFHLNSIAQLKSGTLLISGEAGVLFRSTNRGETWDVISSPYEGSFFGVTGTSVRNVALAFGLRGHIFRSEDDGVSWTQIVTGTESTLVSADDHESGYVTAVGSSGTVMFSKDGGLTFKEFIRSDRISNSSVVYLDKQRVVIVGEQGAVVTAPDGTNISGH